VPVQGSGFKGSEVGRFKKKNPPPFSPHFGGFTFRQPHLRCMINASVPSSVILNLNEKEEEK
jgi:hypothetical protein